jgi:hypothetical protein
MCSNLPSFPIVAPISPIKKMDPISGKKNSVTRALFIEKWAIHPRNIERDFDSGLFAIVPDLLDRPIIGLIKGTG